MSILLQFILANWVVVVLVGCWLIFRNRAFLVLAIASKTFWYFTDMLKPTFGGYALIVSIIAWVILIILAHTSSQKKASQNAKAMANVATAVKLIK